MREGLVANELRLRDYGEATVARFVLGWGLVFLLFGAVFAVTFAGSKFEPQVGEQIVKSFFLTFYRDRPGRFVLTTRRIVFVPEAFSQLLRATRVSIELDLITNVESHSTAAGGTLTLSTADGSIRVFKMPNLVLKPMLIELEKVGLSSRAAVNSDAAAAVNEKI